MNIKLSQSTASVPVESLDILVLSDAAPSRNGVGAYYQDLLEHLAKRVHSIRLVSPTITNGKWDAGLVLPLPGDKTQKLCLPNLWKLNRLINDIRPDIVVIATPGVYGLTGAYLAN